MAASTGVGRSDLTSCDAPLPPAVNRTYTLAGRVRLLFIWTGRRTVGEARLSWNTDDRGTRRLELLIGTDPDRAPRSLNLWGYLSETVCTNGADLFGIMRSSADERQTAGVPRDERSSSGPGLTAIRAHQDGSDLRTEILHLPEDGATARDLARLLDDLPAPSEIRRTSVPADADPGFLVAMDHLLAESVDEYLRTRAVTANRSRTYVYAGRSYRLAERQARLRPRATREGPGMHLLEGRFEITNLSTNHTTTFRVEYGAGGPLAGVPIHIVYGPHWWLEIDLTLASPPPPPLAGYPEE